MDVEDDIRPGEDQVFVAAFERGAAEIRRREIALLHHGPHGSVEHETRVASASSRARRRSCRLSSVSGTRQGDNDI